MSDVYARLIARGYTPSVLNKIVNTYLCKYLASPTPALTNPAPHPDDSRARVFLHLPYHLLDPPSTEVQALFRKHVLQEHPINPYASTPLYKLSNARGHLLGI